MQNSIVTHKCTKCNEDRVQTTVRKGMKGAKRSNERLRGIFFCFSDQSMRHLVWPEASCPGHPQSGDWLVTRAPSGRSYHADSTTKPTTGSPMAPHGHGLGGIKRDTSIFNRISSFISILRSFMMKCLSQFLWAIVKKSITSKSWGAHDKNKALIKRYRGI